jgi:hypothetical protein
MTSGDGMISRDAQDAVLVLLVRINEHMRRLRESLQANPAVKEVMQGCDVYRFNGDGACFGVWIDVTPSCGDAFMLGLGISRDASGWEFDRRFDTQGDYGAVPVITFDAPSFASFGALADRYEALVAEFVDTVPAFDFAAAAARSEPWRMTAWWRSLTGRTG